MKKIYNKELPANIFVWAIRRDRVAQIHVYKVRIQVIFDVILIISWFH